MKDSILDSFFKKIAPVRHQILRAYLFGSRAKGTERPDSDYDLLLVVNPSFTQEDKSQLYDGVMDVLLETGKLVSLKIFKEPKFKELSSIPTPFMHHVLTEGIRIG